MVINKILVFLPLLFIFPCCQKDSSSNIAEILRGESRLYNLPGLLDSYKKFSYYEKLPNPLLISGCLDFKKEPHCQMMLKDDLISCFYEDRYIRCITYDTSAQKEHGYSSLVNGDTITEAIYFNGLKVFHKESIKDSIISILMTPLVAAPYYVHLKDTVPIGVQLPVLMQIEPPPYLDIYVVKQGYSVSADTLISGKYIQISDLLNEAGFAEVNIVPQTSGTYQVDFYLHLEQYPRGIDSSDFVGNGQNVLFFEVTEDMNKKKSAEFETETSGVNTFLF